MSTTPTSPQWLTLFRRFTNAHFATCADEHKEGVSDAAVARRYDASNAAEKAFLGAVHALEAESAEKDVTIAGVRATLRVMENANCELGKKNEHLENLLHAANEKLKAQECPNVVKGAEGTSYCALAESSVAALQKNVVRLGLLYESVAKERDALKDWKECALLVESRWDCQRVAKLLGITLGHDIRPNIEPKIRELLVDKARLDWLIKQGPPGATAGNWLTEEVWELATMFAEENETDAKAVRAAIDRARDEDVADSMRQAPVD